ncbi:Protein of unknown function [Bacillus mycoides]|nr:Protein of unknown function [Bacillus mycoides]
MAKKTIRITCGPELGGGDSGKRDYFN